MCSIDFVHYETKAFLLADNLGQVRGVEAPPLNILEDNCLLI